MNGDKQLMTCQTTFGPVQAIMGQSGLWPIHQPFNPPFILEEFPLKPALNSWAESRFQYGDKT